MKNYFYLLLLFLSINTLSAQSNLFVDSSLSPEEMLEDFFNSGNIIVSNPVYTGDAQATVFFDAGATDLGLEAGILFSTGVAEHVVNGSDEYISTIFDDNITPGDIDLMEILGTTINDQVTLEFDFVSTESDVLSFQYIFGSEEYPEFTCSNFNDVFGFFVSGPGITGPYSNGAQNISTIPGSDAAVSINNVNDNPNCGEEEWMQYYVDNAENDHIAYDGKTTLLNATFPVVAQETYHVKLVIGDVGDSSFDSGVFLSFSSLGADTLLVPSTGFAYQLVDDNMLVVEDDTKYASSWLWDFGNGETSTERHPEAVVYDEPGTYTITLRASNFCCTNTHTETITIGSPNSVFDNQVVDVPMAVFPNPVQGNEVNVELPTGLTFTDVQLVDMLGKTYGINYSLNNGDAVITLPDDFKAGIYFIKVLWQGGGSTISRFVKN